MNEAIKKGNRGHVDVCKVPLAYWVARYFSMVSLCPPISKETLTLTDVSVLKGNIESSAKSLGRYIKYLPSFLLNKRPLPVLVNFSFTSF